MMHEYIKSILPIKTGVLGKIREYGVQNGVPIIRDDVAQLLDILVRASSPKRILEVGTAIGYSSILMAMAMAEVGRIDTVEISTDMVALARENILQAEKQDVIRVIAGDALEVLPCLSSEYDLIFIDGAKGHYLNLYDDIKRLLKSGGLLVCDNVIFQGKILNAPKDTPRKFRTIVTNMREFLEILCTDKQFETTILETGDGVSLSYRKET